MSSRLLLPLLIVIPQVLLAQDSSEVQSLPEERHPSVTAGVTTGSMVFADHRVQQGATGVLRYHFARAASIAVSPTFARMTFPAALGGGAVGGVTDLPVELTLDHSFDEPWSPTVGLSLGSTLPIGNQQIGFGSGGLGGSVGVGLGLSPIDLMSMHLGAGRPLTDYSVVGALGASNATWGDAEFSIHLEHLDATIGFDGDIASSDSLGPARAVALSFATALPGQYTLTLSGGHGVSGPAARWSVALGFGTDFAGLQAIGSSSPIQRFMRSIGGGSHRGSGSGTGSSGSGHGRAP